MTHLTHLTVIVVPSLKVIHSRVLIQGDTSIIKKGARQLFLYVPTYYNYVLEVDTNKKFKNDSLL